VAVLLVYKAEQFPKTVLQTQVAAVAVRTLATLMLHPLTTQVQTAVQDL
jgi:hypothetical protein